MGFLAHLPELCDITFLVGEDKEPVCAVRAILGTLSLSLCLSCIFLYPQGNIVTNQLSKWFLHKKNQMRIYIWNDIFPLFTVI